MTVVKQGAKNADAIGLTVASVEPSFDGSRLAKGNITSWEDYRDAWIPRASCVVVVIHCHQKGRRLGTSIIVLKCSEEFDVSDAWMLTRGASSWLASSWLGRGSM